MNKIIFLFTVFALFVVGVFTLIIFNSSPLDSQRSVVPMFFFFEALALFSVTFLVFLFSKRIKNTSLPRRSLATASRRSLFFSLSVTGLTVLSSYGVLNILSGLSFVFAIVLIDLLLENRHQGTSGTNDE